MPERDDPATTDRSREWTSRAESAPGVVDRLALAGLGRILLSVGRGQRDRALVPRWVNQTVVELDEAGRLAERALADDPKALQRLPLLLARERVGIFAGPDRASGARPSGGRGAWVPIPGAIHAPMMPPFGGGPGRAPSGGPGLPPSAAPGRGGHPCMVDGGHAVNIGLGGLKLDLYWADRQATLTQPGAHTVLARTFLLERITALEHYRDLVVELATNRLGLREFDALSRVDGAFGVQEPLIHDDLGDPVLVPGPPPGRPGLMSPSQPPLHGGRSLPMPFGLPVLPGGGGGGRSDRCDFWQDCLDTFVELAENYQLGSLCPQDSDIDSITPAAVCRGTKGVELQLRPAPGESFNVSGICTPYLQRGQNHREELTVVSASAQLITVALPEATTSGCIGFRGPTSGSTGNLAMMSTCMRMGLIHNPDLVSLLTPAGQPVHIWCDPDGRNRFEVVPPPVLDYLHATSEASSVSPTGADPSSLTILAEGCRDAVLHWRFDFGGEDPTVDPADYVRVSVTNGAGVVVADGLGHDDTYVSNERELETYTVVAVADVGGDTCGQASATVVIEREQRLHLDGPLEIRTGEFAQLELRRSCPSPAGGTTLTLTSSDPARLEVPATATIAEGDDAVMVAVTASGAGCSVVTVTAQADGHVSATWQVGVYDVPVVTQVQPSAVDACAPFTVQVLGSCFAVNATTVRVRKDGTERTLSVQASSAAVLTAGLLAGEGLDPGSWELVVTARGLESQPATFTVAPVAPVIEEFVGTLSILGAVWPCVDTPATLVWQVRNAQRVTVRQVGVTPLVSDVTSPSICGSDIGQATHTANGARTYRLHAHPAGSGDPVTADWPFFARSVPRARGVRFLNESTSQWRLWRYSSSSGNWSGTNVAAGASVDVLFEACAYQFIFAVNRSEVGNQVADDVGQALTVSNAASLVLSPVIVPQPSLATPNNPPGEFHVLGDPSQQPMVIGVT